MAKQKYTFNILDFCKILTRTETTSLFWDFFFKSIPSAYIDHFFQYSTIVIKDFQEFLKYSAKLDYKIKNLYRSEILDIHVVINSKKISINLILLKLNLLILFFLTYFYRWQVLFPNKVSRIVIYHRDASSHNSDILRSYVHSSIMYDCEDSIIIVSLISLLVCSIESVDVDVIAPTMIYQRTNPWESSVSPPTHMILSTWMPWNICYFFAQKSRSGEEIELGSWNVQGCHRAEQCGLD